MRPCLCWRALSLGPIDKSQIRSNANTRGAIDPGAGFLVVSGLFTWLSGRLPGTVTAYLALPDEVDLSPLFDRLPGWRWVLPRVEHDGVLTFRDREIPTEIHRFGMEQPIERGPITPTHEIDVFLVPGLAFDLTGARVGRGGGFYDRLLADRRSDAVAVGVATEMKILESVPMYRHDQRVGWLATESGVKESSPPTM